MRGGQHCRPTESNSGNGHFEFLAPSIFAAKRLFATSKRVRGYLQGSHSARQKSPPLASSGPVVLRRGTPVRVQYRNRGKRILAKILPCPAGWRPRKEETCRNSTNP